MLDFIDYDLDDIFKNGFIYACEVQHVKKSAFREIPIKKTDGKIEIENVGTGHYIKIKGKL